LASHVPRFDTDRIFGRSRGAPPYCREHSLPITPPLRADYAQNFRCIGSDCEDTCCQGWNVPIDQAAYEKYQNLPDSPLRTLIDANMLRISEGAKPAVFAQLRMNGENQCPLLTADRLCQIQTELGEELLSHACATYPRIVNSIAGIQQTALALSCPEAARIVLLNQELLTPEPLDSNHESTSRAETPADTLDSTAGTEFPAYPLSLISWFWPIRQLVLALVRNRSYPLWQRLFLLSIFCRRLDEISSGELALSVPEFLGDFQAAVTSGALRTAMETLPMDRAAQMDVVLRLAGMMLHRSNVRPRFVECVQAFTTGIGNGPGATLESLTERSAQAHDRYYAPFFAQHPYIPENYLINTILRLRFPFGKEDAQAGKPFSMARECALLTAQFALMKGFLIGVAGFHREAFSAAHVVHTVQAASKHFEHHPEFLNLAYELLMESRMEGARGMAILLRNEEPKPLRPAAPEIHAPAPREIPRSVAQSLGILPVGIK
jgi:lysine-N-methylase